jgi:hypothetical protein
MLRTVVACLVTFAIGVAVSWKIMDRRVSGIEERVANIGDVKMGSESKSWWCRTGTIKTCWRTHEDCDRQNKVFPQTAVGCAPQRLSYCGGRMGDDCYIDLIACEENRQVLYDATPEALCENQSANIQMCFGVE